MNTIHDLGGMDGFTLKERDQGFPLKEDWERQVWGFALALWAKAIPGYTDGMSRAHLERLPPELYVSMPYYAKWLQAQENALIAGGLVSREELDDSEGPVKIPDLGNFVPAGPGDVTAFLTGDTSYEVPATTEPQYAIGDEVVVTNEHPTWHTRQPRYMRGHRGVIHKHHGVHILEDELPEDRHPGPQHLYTVMFTARELWGERGHKNDRIFAELTEFHIKPAN
jgi:nitrile hydratase